MTRLETDLSFTEGGDPSQEIRGVVNIPVIDNEFGLRVAGTFAHEGGWIDQPAADEENINDNDLRNIRVQGMWRPIDELEVNGTVVYHRNDGSTGTAEDDDGNFTQVFNEAPVPNLTSPKISDDYELYNLTVVYDLDAVRLLSSSSYMQTEKNIQHLPSKFPATPDLTLDLLFSNIDIGSDVFSQELRVSSYGSGPFQWTLGGFYRDSETHNDSVIEAGLSTGPFGPPANVSQPLDSKTWAVFGNASYQLSDQLEVGLGVRYFEDEQKDMVQEETFDSTSPRVYASYDIAENIRAYASVAKGFRSGGFNAPGQPAFDSETVWTYEVGSKMSLLDNSLIADIAIYQSDYEDVQVFGSDPSDVGVSLGRTTNAGEATIEGIDLALNWLAAENFNIKIQGNYLDMEFTNVNAVDSSHAVGDPLDAVPEYSYGISTGYVFQIRDNTASFHVDYNKQGQSVFRNRSVGEHYVSYSDEVEMLNVNLDLSVSENMSFGIFAQNLLNDRGELDPFAIEYSAARSRPRTFGFKVGMEFQ